MIEATSEAISAACLGDGRRTEHDRETTIEVVIHPEIEPQAGEHTDGDSNCSAETTGEDREPRALNWTDTAART